MFKKIKYRIKELFDKIREKLKQLMKEITERFREKQYVAYLEKLKTMIKKDPGLGNVTVTVTDCDEFEDDGYDGKEVLDIIVLLAQQYAQEFRTINQAMDDLDNVPMPSSIRDQNKEEINREIDRTMELALKQNEEILTRADEFEQALDGNSFDTQMSLRAIVNGGYQYITRNLVRITQKIDYIEADLNRVLDKCDRILKEVDNIDPRLIKLINQTASVTIRAYKLYMKALQKATSQLINGTKEAVREYKQNNSRADAANATRTTITNESVYDERLAWLLQ